MEEDYVEYDELTWEEEMRMAENEIQSVLGISFLEFRDRWFKGEFINDPDPKVHSLGFWIGVDERGE